MRRTFRRIAVFLLAAALFVGAVPVSAGAASKTGFPDIESGIWYENNLWLMQTYLPGLFQGIKDEDGVTRFHPTQKLKRGEFLRVAMTAAELYTADHSRDKIHWAGKYYTMAMENNFLVADPFFSSEAKEGSKISNAGGEYVLFDCTWTELEKPVTRYEMAAILNNIDMAMYPDKTVTVHDVESYIPDYDEISTNNARFTTAVEQAYGKGLLSGYVNTEGLADGSFGGDRSLTRAEAVVVIYRLLWKNDRKLAAFAQEPEPEVITLPSSRPAVFKSTGTSQSFAEWLNSGNHYTYSGGLDNQARMILYGTTAKNNFWSAADAGDYLQTITVPIWIINSAGQKESSTASLTVNWAVAEEVACIFQEIYDDPEQFPMCNSWSVGGARFTDTLRHSWGCAIDINPYYNCECNTKSGYLRVTCGYGWWPSGTAWTQYAGSLSSSSVYSIGKNEGDYGYSVVRAFAHYGWGWGGNGWSNGRSFDYMHFSVLSSGG